MNSENDFDRREASIVLEQIRPRMRRAKAIHVTKAFGALAALPLLWLGAAAFAADGIQTVEVQSAAAPITASQTPTTLSAEPPDRTHIDQPRVSEQDDSTESATATTTEPPSQTELISLGTVGSADVIVREGSLDLASLNLANGWEVVSTDIKENTIVIVIANGEEFKMIEVFPDVRDRIGVRVSPVNIPTTTKAPAPVDTVAPATTVPSVDRFVVEVPGKGSFVVERDGDTLFVGNIEDAAGITHDVVKAEGWKVQVAFTDGHTLWFGKAWIDDFGEVHTHTWDELVPASPVYKWVEIPNVGAAKFKLLEGRLMLVEMVPSAGFSPWSATDVGTTLRVEFEGNGQLWFIDVAIANGEMVWEITDATPPPSTTSAPASTTTAPVGATTTVP